MLRAVAIVVLALAAVALAAPKPPRADCVESALKVTFDSVNADKLTVVALSDDVGPTTLAAAYAGTVYVYYRTVTNETTKKGSRLVYGQWSQIQTIVTDNPLEQESFGGSLALSGDVLAVGQPRWAYRSSTQSEFTGAVYLYRRAAPGANYTYEDVVYERDNVGQVPPNALFGASVSLVRNGTVLLVGAPGCCPPDFVGQAFTYYYGLQGNDTAPSWGETNGPSQSQVLGLGSSVALADTNPGFVLMGAPGYSATTATGPGVYTAPISTAGVVDVSRRSALPLNVLTITPAPDPATSECGFALSDVDETRRRVIWSCPGFNGARGATYTSDLVGSQWSTSRRIGSPAPNAGGRFGQSLAYQDPMLIVTEAGLTGGLVHVFQVVPVTLKPEAYLNTQTFEFANSLPFDQYANLTISVDFRANVLAVGAYAQLTVYDCPLPDSPATPLRAALALVAALVALLLLAL